jgi:hypothetical protein
MCRTPYPHRAPASCRGYFPVTTQQCPHKRKTLPRGKVSRGGNLSRAGSPPRAACVGTPGQCGHSTLRTRAIRDTRE